MGNVLYSALIGAVLASGTLVSAASTPVGCYKNPPQNKPALGGGYPQLDSTKMTVGLCEQHCARLKSNRFSLERGRTCSCGDIVVPEAAAVTEAQCRTKCAGDAGAYCGATGYFSLYEADTTGHPSLGQWGPIVKFSSV